MCGGKQGRITLYALTPTSLGGITQNALRLDSFVGLARVYGQLTIARHGWYELPSPFIWIWYSIWHSMSAKDGWGVEHGWLWYQPIIWRPRIFIDLRICNKRASTMHETLRGYKAFLPITSHYIYPFLPITSKNPSPRGIGELLC